jgi:hypothetical protein
MALTTLAVRQFYQIPTEYGTFARPASTYVVTGSVSRLLVDGGRPNLANDSMTITTQNSSPYIANSGTPEGWWPSPDISAAGYGIIVGGNDVFANTSPDGRTSTVSCWGWIAQEDQAANNTEFLALASSVLGATYESTGSAKAALQTAGYYYQYPVGFDGQTPGTGPGSDS